MYRSLRKLLAPLKYCSLIVDQAERGGGGFPLAWAVGLAGRSYLRLRDEKIGLANVDGNVTYCLFMQGQEDSRPAEILMPDSLAIGSFDKPIPGWIIPRPPPRKKNEILHPAKFPETLISEFIRLFTKPNDNVFDPMAGTGSSIVAAVLEERYGYGVELNSEYVKIARNRIIEYCRPQLSIEFQKPTSSLIVAGDAAHLELIEEFNNLLFNYTVTSPPYWSMLSNTGSENQQARRDKNLPLVYSDDSRDTGNVLDYDVFLNGLVDIYNQIANKMADGAYFTDAM